MFDVTLNVVAAAAAAVSPKTTNVMSLKMMCAGSRSSGENPSTQMVALCR